MYILGIFVVAVIVFLIVSYYVGRNFLKNREVSDFLSFLQTYYDYRMQLISFQEVIIFCRKKTEEYNYQQNKLVSFVGRTFYPAIATIVTDSTKAIDDLEEVYGYEMDEKRIGLKLTNGNLWLLNLLIADVYFLTGKVKDSVDWLATGMGVYNADSWKKISADTSKQWIETYTTETAELRKAIRERAPMAIAQREKDLNTYKNEEKCSIAALYVLLARDSFSYSVDVKEEQEYIDKAKKWLSSAYGNTEITPAQLQEVYQDYTAM